MARSWQMTTKCIPDKHAEVVVDGWTDFLGLSEVSWGKKIWLVENDEVATASCCAAAVARTLVGLKKDCGEEPNFEEPA